MKKTSFMVFMAIGVILSPQISSSQEVAVIANNDGNDALPIAQLKNLVNALGAKFNDLQTSFADLESELNTVENNLTQTTDKLTVVEGDLEKVNFCNNKQMIYAPSASGADAQGCVKQSPTPVGTIVLWPSASIPTGWIEMRGQSTAPYPTLKKFGAVIPNMRGMFVRGAAPGRGVGTYQADADQRWTGKWNADDRSAQYPEGIARSWPSPRFGGAKGSGGTYDLSLDNSRQIRTADESRPKNVALVYIIKYK